MRHTFAGQDNDSSIHICLNAACSTNAGCLEQKEIKQTLPEDVFQRVVYNPLLEGTCTAVRKMY